MSKIILITYKETNPFNINYGKTVVSHGVDYLSGDIVTLTEKPLKDFKSVVYDKEICEYILEGIIHKKHF